MPISLYAIFNTNPKKLKLTALFILSPLFFYAQTLTGLWTGALSNDSTTVRKDQSFEIALTEYKGKVYGYSRSEFIVDDVLYFVVKRVKGTIEGDICEVKDDEIIAFNFPTKLDKGVKVTSTFRRNKTDSSWYLDGTWKTNQTKKYYTVTGKVALQEEKDLNASKIFPHLEELKLANDVAFYKERKETPAVVKVVKPEKPIVEVPVTLKDQSQVSAPVAVITPVKKTEDPVKTPDHSAEIAISKPALQKADPVKTETITTPVEEKNKPVTPVKEVVASVNTQVDETEKVSDKIKEPVSRPDLSTSTREVPKMTSPAGTTYTKNTVAVTTPVVPNKTEDRLTEKPNAKTGNPDARAETAVVKTPVQEKSNTPVNTYNDPVGEDIPRSAWVKPVSEVKQTQQGAETKNNVSTNPKTDKAGTGKPAANSPVVVSVPVILPNKTIEMNENWNEPVKLPAIPVVKTSLAERQGAAESINKRKTEVSQVVNFKSDSLELALYDNGQIDGDTVSVLMNGELILAKQGLKATAIRKTIYITRGRDDEFTLVLYAENLGTLPPNTGLLVVHDGEDVYNLRFSSDFQKNAGIVFRRKK